MNRIERLKDLIPKLKSNNKIHPLKIESLEWELKFLESEKKKLIITDVVASLPSKDKLYLMAKVIVDKQQKVLTISNKEVIDWEDLTDDWFDWLEETLIG